MCFAINVYGVSGGKKMGRGNRNTKAKFALMPLCPLQIPHNMIRDRTRALAEESGRLMASTNVTTI
jgi:hypothetical protein